MARPGARPPAGLSSAPDCLARVCPSRSAAGSVRSGRAARSTAAAS